MFASCTPRYEMQCIVMYYTLGSYTGVSFNIYRMWLLPFRVDHT